VVDGQPVRHAKQVRARRRHAAQQAGLARQADEDFLQDVLHGGLVAGQANEEVEERRRVRVVKHGQRIGRPHALKTHARRRFVYRVFRCGGACSVEII
jgi:hypothetical protein